MKFFLFSLLVFCCSALKADALPDTAAPNSLSVVVVGGGPAGLAAAIEARLRGAAVTVVEKRLGYSRGQTLLLVDESVRLLEGWHVACPQMHVAQVDEKSKSAFVGISELENSLLKRAKQLGVVMINGEFVHLSDNDCKITLKTCDSEVCLPYDILIGADGMHSRLRNALGIPLHEYGRATGSVALVAGSDQTDTSIETHQYKEVFIRRILTPAGVSILFAQALYPSDGISSQHFAQIAKEAGWQKEAHLIEAEKAYVFIKDIAIRLQQAQTFALRRKAAILIGDAAASASFFEGMGANTALRTAVHAGTFIADFQADENQAYVSFNRNMTSTTDELINTSWYLFDSKDVERVSKNH